jgi:hypothetical protein
LGGIVADRRVLFREPATRSNGTGCSADAFPRADTSANAGASTSACAVGCACADAGASTVGYRDAVNDLPDGDQREGRRRFSRLSGLR